jgi:CDP-glycerol glycerophosphotransferase
MAAGMPRVSFVVPVHNVEAYLDECLRSVAGQTVGDFEVVMVDDGSTDGSAEIAERHAERDGRLRLVRQANRGLGHARNTGVRAAEGEFLFFVDSDDRLPPDALELLLEALDRTGSDFATGNIHRFNSRRTWPAAFLKRTFFRRRYRTHVERFRWLLSDRMAQNKLWRRSFWEEHALRFPEGVLHEDIPVVLPAHFLARSVDVISRPVYLYRERDDGAPSITQRRTEIRTLRDRLAAIEHVRAFLVSHGPPGSRRWYDESVVEEDLRYHLDALPEAGDEYRAAFLDLANAFVDRAGTNIERHLPAIQRLKWHLVRRRMLPELLEVLRFEATALHARPRTVIRGRLYGDYPFLRDRELAIPRTVYRLDTARRRARHVMTLLRPDRAQPREPRPYHSLTSRPSNLVVPARYGK